MKYPTMLLVMLTTSVSAQHFAAPMLSNDSCAAICVSPLFSDSLSSSFHISIKEKVSRHYHADHTEHVQVLSGEGVMSLADSTFTIRAGDLVVIPKGVAHGVIVTSSIPLQVVSVQAPEFDGGDRHFLEE